MIRSLPYAPWPCSGRSATTATTAASAATAATAFGSRGGASRSFLFEVRRAAIVWILDRRAYVNDDLTEEFSHLGNARLSVETLR